MELEIQEIKEEIETIQAPTTVVVTQERTIVESADGECTVISVQESEEIIAINEVTTILEIPGSEDILVLSEVGPQGIQGEPGTGGASTDVVYPAGEAIGGHRCVVVGNDGKVYYASREELTHMNKVLGITTGAAAINANSTVRAFGEMTEPSWNWTLDQPIFLGLNGLLTQTPPTSGFSLIIAFPISAMKIFVEIKEPILLQ